MTTQPKSLLAALFALIALLLPVLALAGCAGTPASSGEQALSILIDSDADPRFGPFLRDELPALLGMPVEVTVLPVGDGTSKQEQEELEAQRTRMRTQLMSGSGPDLLVLSNQIPTLLDDPVKSIQYLAAAEQVDTARFCYLGGRALHGEVVFPVSRGERTLEQAAGDLAETYRYYFSE